MLWLIHVDLATSLLSYSYKTKPNTLNFRTVAMVITWFLGGPALKVIYFKAGSIYTAMIQSRK